MPAFFSIKDLETRYQIKRGTLHRWIKSGTFPKPMNLGGGHPRWSSEAIKEWERNNEAANG